MPRKPTPFFQVIQRTDDHRYWCGPRFFVTNLPEFWTSSRADAQRFSKGLAISRLRFRLSEEQIETAIETVPREEFTVREHVPNETLMGQKRAAYIRGRIRNFTAQIRAKRKEKSSPPLP